MRGEANIQITLASKLSNLLISNSNSTRFSSGRVTLDKLRMLTSSGIEKVLFTSLLDGEDGKPPRKEGDFIILDLDVKIDDDGDEPVASKLFDELELIGL
jgi:hypothetical protein